MKESKAEVQKARRPVPSPGEGGGLNLFHSSNTRMCTFVLGGRDEVRSEGCFGRALSARWLTA